MRTEGDFIEVARFPDSFLAQLWAGRLKTEGIPAVVQDDLRQDEWAMAQQAFGVATVRLFVHADRADEARELLRTVDKAQVIDAPPTP